MIDSADRASGVAADFIIVPGQQVISGHFTRAAVAEVVMDWMLTNINANAQNNTVSVNSPVTVDTYSIDGSGNVYETSGSVPIPDYYDPIVVDEGSIVRTPLILVNGIPTPIIPADLPLLDIEGAPIDISGASLLGEVLLATLQNGFRNVAQVMDTLAIILTAGSTGKVVTFTTTASNNFGCICNATYTTGGAAATISINTTLLQQQLGLFPVGAVTSNFFYPQAPNIMPWRYVDITCDQLTYCQDVKDATTNNTQKDVLTRWYFAWSAPPTNDKYGFPILQGYQVFSERRAIGFPKQIKWDPIQTIANMSFQSFVAYSTSTTNEYILVPGSSRFVASSPYEFQMTLLLSEI
jgi:hypothetical protein